MLHPGLDTFHLQNLGDVYQGSEIFRVTVGFGNVVEYFAVSAGAALVGLHDRGKEVEVLRAGETLNRLDVGEGFKTEFGAVAEQVFPVLAKGLEPVPDLPVVHVPPVRIIGRVKTAARRGGGGPVKRVGIDLFPDFRNQTFKEPYIIGPERRGMMAHVFPLGPGYFHFIVAAPQAQTGVMPEPGHVLPYLFGDVSRKCVIQHIDITGEHQVLPDYEAQFVADVIKIIVGVIAAAPDPQAVKIGLDAIFQQPPGTLRPDPGKHRIFGDIVGAHGENFDPVHRQGKFPSPLVIFRTDRHGTQPYAARPLIQTCKALAQFHLNAVQGLSVTGAKTVGPPECGFFNAKGKFRIGGNVRNGDRCFHYGGPRLRRR